MPDTSESSTAPFFPSAAGPAATLGDIILWRRPLWSALVVTVATATWVLFDVYKFNFVTVVVWIGMAVVTSLYLYGHLVRLFRKEEPDLTNRQFVREERVVEAARSVGSGIELAVRCLVRMSTNGDWRVLTHLVVELGFLAYLGSLVDFLTLVYLGVVMVMTLPLAYKKNERKILNAAVEAQTKGMQFLYMVDEKVVRRLKGKVVAVASMDEDNHNKDQKEEKVE
ncbi:unnamed protein product [Linum trigynum]|uniref:Reticulon-like protein n=1 Tax=Linum trigynum TaxID=586398 RepID=A0AAV2E3Q2_9ROSI